MPRQAEEKLEYQDVLNFTLTSLRDFLALMGLKKTGKKGELVARAFGAYELKKPKKFSQEEIDRKLKEEYRQRLKKTSNKHRPQFHSERTLEGQRS